MLKPTEVVKCTVMALISRGYLFEDKLRLVAMTERKKDRLDRFSQRAKEPAEGSGRSAIRCIAAHELQNDRGWQED